MRLFIAFLLLCATCQGQMLKRPVSLPRLTGTTGELLELLNQQPGVLINYSSSVVKLAKPIRLSGQEKTVEDVLIVICRKQPVRFVEQTDKIILVADTSSQKKYTISGYVSAKKTGERLTGASVIIPTLNSGTTSNTYGFFSITLPAGTIPMQVSYAGYITEEQHVPLTSDVSLNIQLDIRDQPNETVIVQAAGKKTAPEGFVSGKMNLTSAFVKSVPALLGESDLLKTMQLLPGIQGGYEGTSGLHVRGGSADQNLILLDGVPVYNTTHAFGLFSIFNADAVQNAAIVKGGIPASYGGRLSSVVDVQLKEGDKYQLHGEGGVGLIFSKLTLEGPIQKGRSSFLVSGRRTYVDLFLRPIQAINKSDIRMNPFFTDLNAKANFEAGKKDHIYVSCYLGQDKLLAKEEAEGTNYQGRYDSYKGRDGFSWGNMTGMLRWNHVLNKKTFSNVTATYSRYRFKTISSYEEKLTDPDHFYQEKNVYHSSIRDWGIRADLDHLPSPNHFIKTGLSATFHRYQPGSSYFYQEANVVLNDTRVNYAASTSGEYDVYAEDDIRLLPGMKANIGIRLSLFHAQKNGFTSLQPRFSWLYQLKKRWTLSASYHEMNQFIHQLSNSNIGLPTDLWLPVTSRVPPQKARQASAGVSYHHKQVYSFGMDLYYKTMKNVIDYIDQSVFFNAYDNWEDKVTTGKGRSYGIEWSLQKTKGKLQGLAAYTISKSTRQFDDINEGRSFPFLFDRRHEIKLAAVWKRSARFEAGANWLYTSGRPVTLPDESYYDPYTWELIDVYSSRNNVRLPAYHRLDLSLKFIKPKKHYTRTWLVSIYNAYNRFNIFYLDEIRRNDQNTFHVKAKAVFPIVPSISYQFKF
ncbi:TonB-dependent receptor [Longitalea arenae]|uniref:TonB-dependent receptor n=1 Tax=Longitalea arenae TaxID=2812558 RepID=UPI001967FBC3|nr:TonB-dependent receptor [Longitalea arenae]